MCLNASLAGLVAITAPCDVTDCFGAICIGFVSGLLVCFGVCGSPGLDGNHNDHGCQ